MIKLLIAGSRGFNDYERLVEYVNTWISQHNYERIEILSGGARGADSLAEQYARERDIDFKLFPANWTLYGKSAGYRRNEQMAKYATHAILFWDGTSKGTKHMMDLCMKHNVDVVVVRY